MQNLAYNPGGRMNIFRRSSSSGNADRASSVVRDLKDSGHMGHLIKELLSVFDREFPPRRPQVIDLLTFKDVVAYFTDKHPGDPRIRAGALLSNPHPKGRLIFQVFLDDKDALCVGDDGAPYGRRMVARKLDGELAARFGQQDLLIFR